MDFSSTALIKGLAGLAVVSAGGTGVYFLHDHFSNSTTLFDQKLLEYLDKQDHDIVFGVYDGSTDDSTTAISENFASFSSQNSKVAIVKIEINTNNTNNPLRGSEATTELDKLKRLNGEATGTDKIWECRISFNKGTSSAETLENNLKTKLVNNSSPFGFFNKLQKDTTSDTEITKPEEKKAIKDFKKKIIRFCAAERKSKNKETNKKTGAIISSDLLSNKEFKLKNNSEESSLIIENKSDFESWFS